MITISVDIPRTTGKEKAATLKEQFIALGWEVGVQGYLPNSDNEHIRTLVLTWKSNYEPQYPDGKDAIYTVQVK